MVSAKRLLQCRVPVLQVLMLQAPVLPSRYCYNCYYQVHNFLCHVHYYLLFSLIAPVSITIVVALDWRARQCSRHCGIRGIFPFCVWTMAGDISSVLRLVSGGGGVCYAMLACHGSVASVSTRKHGDACVCLGQPH